MLLAMIWVLYIHIIKELLRLLLLLHKLDDFFCWLVIFEDLTLFLVSTLPAEECL